MTTPYLHICLKRICRIFFWLICILSAGCRGGAEVWEELPPPGDSETPPAPVVTYISVRLQTGIPTRAVEVGDGWEPGKEHENRIDNLCLFFFPEINPGENINDAIKSRNPISKTIYFPKEELTNTGGETIKIPARKVEGLERRRYHVVAVANAGDLTSVYSQGIPTSKLFEDIRFGEPFVRGTGGTTFSSFVMSSATDAVSDLTQPGTEQNPIVLTLQIERLAARIDLIPSQTAGQPVNVYLTPAGDRVTIRRIQPVNCMEEGSYLFKNTGDYDHVTYLEPEAGGYVMDPFFGNKTPDKQEACTGYYRNPYLQIKGQQNFKPVGTDEYILDYTMENTVWTECQLPGFVTGVVFECDYERALSNENGTVDFARPELRYYTYWIQHARKSVLPAKMHLAIVRNNVYKLRVVSFSGPGKPNPEDPDPDAQIYIQITVKNWNLIDHPEIIL